jgi:hypothetical protein
MVAVALRLSPRAMGHWKAHPVFGPDYPTSSKSSQLRAPATMKNTVKSMAWRRFCVAVRIAQERKKNREPAE